MSLVTNKQQELIDKSIEENIRTYDKVADQYVSIRKKISVLVNEISHKEEISEEDTSELNKLKNELAESWEGYSRYLDVLQQRITIKIEIDPDYSSGINRDHEILQQKKLQLNESIREIKESHLPLIKEMKSLIAAFAKGLNQKASSKYHSKQFVSNLLDSPTTAIDIRSLITTRNQLIDLFSDFDSKIRDLTSVYDIDGSDGHPIKSSHYIDKELLLHEKFLPLDGDEYLFRVSKLSDQDDVLAKASVAKYDKLNAQLEKEIADLITRATVAKQGWLETANKFDAIKGILQPKDSMEVD